MAVVSLSDVTLIRNSKELLSNVSWQINAGEHWALIGRNGSGKTLTLKIISGYLWPTTGSVEVLDSKFGEVDLREIRKRIGWVSPGLQYSLQKPVPVEEVVLSGFSASFGSHSGVKDEITDSMRERARDAMLFMECEHLKDRLFNTLSTGEEKRVVIARALLGEPELLILDEPCNGLDLVSREEFLRAIKKLGAKKDGPTIIHVTHHVEEIMPFVTHCSLMKDCKVSAQGTKEEMLTTELLSSALGLDVSIEKRAGRYYSRLD